MYIGYLNDRKELEFSCIEDMQATELILNLKKVLTKRISVSYFIEKSEQICILIFSKEVLVAVFIFLTSSDIHQNVDHRLFRSLDICQSSVIKSKPNNLRLLDSPGQISDFILKLKGGADFEQFELSQEEQEKLIKSILSKTAQSDIDKFSINKLLKRLAQIIDPVISNERFWKIISEFKKPLKSDVQQLSDSNRNILGTGPNLVGKQFKQFEPESKSSSSIFADGFTTTVSPMGKRVQTHILQASQVTTAERFSADPVTGEIQDINVAFNHFRRRMTQIGNTYTGEKQEYFFKQLDQCEIDRFKFMSTEKGRTTIYGVREAETMLQTEFEGIHEPNSIRRPTELEVQQNNKFDGRFCIGKLSGRSNSLNEEYTDIDAKVLISGETLQHQADQRRSLGHRNPNPISMSDQGKRTGFSIVGQKHKHCDPTKNELPSSPSNVKHVVNLLELLPIETEIAKTAVIDGARVAWADRLNIPESSVSDQTALQGIIFLNEDCTIERVN